MGLITGVYRKNFLRRYDCEDAAIPYYCAEDFPGLSCEEGSFANSFGTTIKYFFYHYENPRTDKLLLFCPGMGPGHVAYLAEIATLCRAGYRVLTLDYTGCGASGGEKLPSINAPTHDALELLELLHPQEEVIPIGHSLGGYTALNVAHRNSGVRRAVILSGFVSITDEMMTFVKLRPFAACVGRLEKKLDPAFGSIDNLAYLANTTDRILWIHSTDDSMVNYKHNAGRVKKLQNPNLRVITVEGKKHNPQYTQKALENMNAWIGEYFRLVIGKKLKTLEEKQAYFADKPIESMTEQDPAVYEEIFRWIKG